MASELVGKVLVTGATGLIGKSLCQRLVSMGYELVVTGRRPEPEFRRSFSWPCVYIQWSDPAKQPLPENIPSDLTSVIHLMGEPLVGKRWTPERKKRFRSSRIQSTENLLSGLPDRGSGLESFVSGSAIGIYGDRGDEVLTENSELAGNELAQLCRDWEAAAQRALCRSVQVRTGIVLAREGGALAQMEPIFKYNLGGPLASGKQWMSWIHIDDMVNLLIHCVQSKSAQGPVNAVAPHSVTNKEFTRELAQAMKKVALFPVPKLALKLAFGEMSQVLLGSQRVSPEVLLEEGFVFGFPTLASALEDLYS